MLIEAARRAAGQAYAPYSGFHVGAALVFADGAVVTGANVENVSYGLSLCAETVTVANALADGRRGGLVAVAVSGHMAGAVGAAGVVRPCGRCRQVLAELAALDGADPMIWCDDAEQVFAARLSELLPHAFTAFDVGA